MDRLGAAVAPPGVLPCWTADLTLRGEGWTDVPRVQEQAAACIKRSLKCAELARAGYRDLGSAVLGLSHAMLIVDGDLPTALCMTHAWLSRTIPSGMCEGRHVEDAETWRRLIVGPTGSAHDRRWLAWGVALAIAELSARSLPWQVPAASLVEMLVAEGYEPAPWERRELERCRRTWPD